MTNQICWAGVRICSDRNAKEDKIKIQRCKIPWSSFLFSSCIFFQGEALREWRAVSLLAPGILTEKRNYSYHLFPDTDKLCSL